MEQCYGNNQKTFLSDLIYVNYFIENYIQLNSRGVCLEKLIQKILTEAKDEIEMLPLSQVEKSRQELIEYINTTINNSCIKVG